MALKSGWATPSVMLNNYTHNITDKYATKVNNYFEKIFASNLSQKK